MRWFRINKTAPAETKHYRAWKLDLAVEGGNQCVYCCIHEGMFGGIRNYHVEHYRPKSKFAGLEHAYENLFYACAICNVFKSDSWLALPNDPNDWTCKHFPDPSVVDFGAMLRIQERNHHVVSDFVAGKFLIERLHLNRPQLVIARRAKYVYEKLSSLSAQLEVRANKVEGHSKEDSDLLKEVIAVLRKMVQVLARTPESRPYVQADTR